MKYIIDHDFHIHSQLSLCSNDEGQTTQAILEYAKKNGFKKICLTDHLWDDKIPGASGWYAPQNLEHIKKSLPLPQDENVKFYFGAETEMDKFMTLGCARETIDELDFLVIPTTHLFIKGFTYFEEDNTLERKIALWEERMHALLDKDLPWYKIGLAHSTCISYAKYLDVDHVTLFSMIKDEVYGKAFARCAEKGLGVELNFNSLKYTKEEFNKILRPYRIAKECGCKFYFGSDAHHPEDLEYKKENFENIAENLNLTEDDKFHFPV